MLKKETNQSEGKMSHALFKAWIFATIVLNPSGCMSATFS